MRITGLFKHPFRVIGRLIWLTAECVLAATRYSGLVVRRRGALPRVECARWLQAACRRVLRIFAFDVRTQGPVPERGLLVSNHLGYLDILVLAAATPCVFVAKSEVLAWPVLGWFAWLAGTIFVRRARRACVRQTTEEIREVLEAGVLVVLFPEGTSTGGSVVLPFKSSLLEPVIAANQPVTTACLHYALAEGDVAEELCYWKNMTLVPHLLNLLSKSGVDASVLFRQVRDPSGDRKGLARQLHAEVVRSRSELRFASAAHGSSVRETAGVAGGRVTSRWAREFPKRIRAWNR